MIFDTSGCYTSLIVSVSPGVNVKSIAVTVGAGKTKVIDILQLRSLLMSSLRVTSLKGRTSGVSPTLPDGAVVTGVDLSHLQ